MVLVRPDVPAPGLTYFDWSDQAIEALVMSLLLS